MANRNKIKNSFNKGIDTDTSVNKYDNNNYYDAKNLRLISDDHLNSGALTNIKAPLEAFTDNTISSDGNVLAALTIRDVAVIFFQNVSNAASEIYKMEFPYTSFDLVYTDTDSGVKLNFDPSNSIQTVGRYESPSIQKVYWCDGSEVNRYINIMEDHTDGLGVYNDASLLSLTPNANMTSPIATNVLSGGSLFSGTISYAYQLYKKNGNETTVSPLTSIVPLSSRNGQPLNNFRGDEVDVDSGNSVEVTIDNLDLDFNRIRIYSIHYNDVSADPIINIVSESDYTTSDYIFIDNGVNSLQTLSLSEFRLLGGRVFSSKTLASKKNYLFAGNIKEIKEDIDFDARAYRFPINSVSTNIYESDGTPLAVGGSYTVPEDHDAINYFNNFDNDLDQTSGTNTSSSYPNEFKYNSAIKGGSGLNISYEFTSISNESNVEAALKSSPYLRNINNTSDSYLNPIRTSESTGYKRGEVYRFGIEFLFKNGQKSFVKWIGDIRFPPVNDTDHNLSYSVTNIIHNNQVGIEFAIDLSSLSASVLDSLSGFQVVRVERNEADKNILCQGLGGPLFYWEDHSPSIDVSMSYSQIPSIYDYFNSSIAIAESDSSVSSPKVLNLDRNIMEINSPELAFNKDISFKSGDRMSAVGACYNAHESSSFVTNAAVSYGGFFRERNYVFSTAEQFKLTEDIQDYKQSELREKITSAYDTFDGKTISHRTGADINASGSEDPYESYRGSSGLISVNNLFNTSLIYNHNPRLIFILEYIRNRFGTQYGGNTFNARSQNTYIPISYFSTEGARTFVRIEDLTSNAITIGAWGGDTFTSSFDMMRSCFDPNMESGAISDTSAQEYITFPVETSINCDYRRDEIIKYFTDDTDFVDTDGDGYTIQETTVNGITNYPDNYPSGLTDLYLYNDAYSRNNNAQVGSTEPFDFETEKSFDVMITASDEKINGEYIDSWTKFNINLFLEVDSKLGPLNRLINHNDKLIFLQDNGIGVVAVDDRAVTQDGNTGNILALATGPVLERYDYISTNFGALKPNAVISTPNNLYFIDENDLSIRIPDSTDPGSNISKMAGISSKLKSRLPGNVFIDLGYDARNKEVLFTTDYDTLVYNELSKSFVSDYYYSADYDTTPLNFYKIGKYIEINGEIHSVAYNHSVTSLELTLYKLNASINPLGDISSVTVIIHPNGNDVFTFDVLDMRINTYGNMGTNPPVTDINTSSVDEIRYQNSYIPSQTESLTLGDNLNKIARVTRTKVPLTNNNKRFVDTYLMATLEFDNTTGHKYLLHDITTIVRKHKS